MGGPVGDDGIGHNPAASLEYLDIDRKPLRKRIPAV